MEADFLMGEIHALHGIRADRPRRVSARPKEYADQVAARARDAYQETLSQLLRAGIEERERQKLQAGLQTLCELLSPTHR